ncbi:MAG: hypothetical protein KBC17_04010, partial [Candidatus Pacebacteria bacterium]|nr:hypothetical protein [Candidatus Paceibacterota bacterium]
MDKIQRNVEILRSKPQHVRERILLGVIIVVGILLVMFWVSTFSYEVKKPSNGSGIVNFFKNIFKSDEPQIAPADSEKVMLETPQAGPVTQ